MNFDELMESDWAKNTTIAEVAEALSDRTESTGSISVANTERALALSKIVHDLCDNVPHDIGLTLEADIQRLKSNENGDSCGK